MQWVQFSTELICTSRLFFFQIPAEISPSPAPPDPARANAMVRDALHKAVLDFEETLQRSHPKQITYTAIPDSPGHDAAVDITETGKSPSLSTILLCKCFAVLQFCRFTQSVACPV